MNAPYISTSPSTITRRTLLRSVGVTLALPLLECMSPVFVRAKRPEVPNRMLLISNNLGVLPKPFFPKDTGRE